MMDVRIYTLVHRELTGQLSEGEAQELMALKSQPHVMTLSKDVETIWNISKEYYPTQSWNTQMAKAAFMDRLREDRLLNTSTSQTSYLKYLLWGILLIVIAGMSYWIISEGSRSAEVQETNVVEEIQFASLSDDTKLWIEPGGVVEEVEYRQVKLNGAAIFDVSRDETSPFRIDMGQGVMAEVLGTSFKAISAHEGRPGTISVRDGQVRLYVIQNKNASVYLNAGETGSIDPSTMAVERKETKGSVVLSSELNFSFHNTPLEEAFPLLSQYFGVEFDLSQASLLGCTFSSPLVQKTTLEATLRNIETAYEGLSIQEMGRSTYRVEGKCTKE